MSLILKLDGYGRTKAGKISLQPNTYTIDTVNKCTGLSPIGTINTLDACLGFLNGIELNIVYDDYSNIDSSVDILINTGSVGYPNTMDAYYNGSYFGANKGSLGDLEINDVIRIYSIDV